MSCLILVSDVYRINLFLFKVFVVTKLCQRWFRTEGTVRVLRFFSVLKLDGSVGQMNTMQSIVARQKCLLVSTQCVL